MEKRRYKIKPPEVWTQVRKDYLSGLDAKTVAARHDVTEASIRARATKEGWSRHPRSEAATPAPQPLSPDDAADLSPDDPNDPAALARAAAQASGRALHAQDFAQARALAALAETYHKLADRDGPGRAARLTVKNAPLQLVFDILTNEAEAERRFAMNTSDKSDWELRGQYWKAKEKLTRANTGMGPRPTGPPRPAGAPHRRP